MTLSGPSTVQVRLNAMPKQGEVLRQRSLSRAEASYGAVQGRLAEAEASLATIISEKDTYAKR